MKRFPQPTRRIRLRLALLAVLSLLFQQVALASYICSSVDVPKTNLAMTAHCDDMPMVKGHAPAKAGAALCPAHCAQQTLATEGTHAPTVPPVSMPALLPATAMLATLPTAHAVHEHSSAWRLSGIPPELRFRVLLI